MRALPLVLLLACQPKPITQSKPSGIDETALDHSVDPCDDFYQHACGGWIARTQIPADHSGWYRSFDEIDQRNENTLHALLDAISAGKSIDPDPYGDKLRDFYGACMDEARIEAASPAEVKALLARADEARDLPSLIKVLAALHLGMARPLWIFSAEQDFKDATRMILRADQSGLGLPDRDYYLKDEARFKDTRDAYLKHVTAMFRLAGATEKEAASNAATVMRIERRLAQASLDKVSRRDPEKIYHRLELAGLEKLAPRIPWRAYLAALGMPNVTEINVAVPEFYKAVDELVEKTPLDELRTYLRWHLLTGAADQLGKAFVDENFAFYEKTLSGTDELPPRWKRCVRATDAALGEALARPFVRNTFGAEGKAETLALVRRIEQAMHKNLQTVPWMDAASRAAAEEKLKAIANKIGFPDRWRNYDALVITRDSYLTSMWRAWEFEARRRYAKVGKPVDRSEWQMTPPTVNAYYDSSLNEMAFPAGILQPPFFAREAPDAVNYGAIGMVMGHELTHGFDDEGRRFDAHGNLREWWTPSVSKAFEERAQCFVEQYSSYVAIDDIHLDGKLTLGENIADVGGVKLAHAAWMSLPAAARAKGRFGDEQLFFYGFAQAWCAKQRDAEVRRRATTDPHSSPKFRVNGPLASSPEFARAFACKPGQKMVREPRCAIW